MANKRIRFGVTNGCYDLISSETADGKITYAKQVTDIKGLKSVSAAVNGEELTEEADNGSWYEGASNNGYDLTLTFEDSESADTFLSSAYGRTKDKNGVEFENTGDEPVGFAFGALFPFKGGTATGRKIWFLNCVAMRHDINGEVKTIGTNEVTVKCRPNAAGDVKTSCLSIDTGYGTFLSAVYDEKVTE